MKTDKRIYTHEPHADQSIEAYNNDPITKYLTDQAIKANKDGFGDSYLFFLMSYRERKYPKLFPLSIPEILEDESQTTYRRAYLKVIRDKGLTI